MPTNVIGQKCFEQLLLGKAYKSEAWLETIRVAAMARAQALNFPSEKHDDWRLINLSSLFQHAFYPVDSFAQLTLADIDQFLITGSIQLVFVDGYYAAGLSDFSPAGAGVTVSSLLDRFGDPLVAEHFAQHVSFSEDAFSALNTRFFEDGAWVHVASEIVAPIHILHVSTKRTKATAIYPRNLIVMDANSSATVIEEYVSLGDGVNFSNAVTEVVLKEQAQLQHVRVQREGKTAFHIGQCSVDAGRGSVYVATSIAIGARISRHALHVIQQGEGAEMQLNGLTYITGRQIADTHTLIDHAISDGKSKQLHKCIADGSAHAIFSGKIMVRHGATKTNSEQSSRSLLLSEKARIDAQPQLEIFNDDVSCKHGATVGQIDAEALFFLKSRGLTEARAKSLLTHAFAAEVIAKIPVPALAASLDAAILERMNGVQV